MLAYCRILPCTLCGPVTYKTIYIYLSVASSHLVLLMCSEAWSEWREFFIWDVCMVSPLEINSDRIIYNLIVFLILLKQFKH